MDLIGVEWRDIPGFEGYYQASIYGQIRSVDRLVKHCKGKNGLRLIKGRMLKPQENKQTKYYTVMLSVNGYPKCFTVHSLVAAAFLGPVPENKVIDHIDGNRQNNIISNLRYVSSKENANNPNTKDNMHSWKTGHNPWNKGKHHTPETIEKIKTTKRKRKDKHTLI